MTKAKAEAPETTTEPIIGVFMARVTVRGGKGLVGSTKPNLPTNYEIEALLEETIGKRLEGLTVNARVERTDA